jgi:hypothetical protein
MKGIYIMKKLMIAIMIGMLISVSVHASSSSDFDKYKDSYNKALDKIERSYEGEVSSIKEKYEAHLDRAIKVALSKGDIKSYDELVAQKKEFMEKRELPEQFKHLLGKPDENKKKAIASLSEKYKEVLTKLKVKAAQSGEIEVARKIDEAIDAVKFVIAENTVEEEEKTVVNRSKPVVTVSKSVNIAPDAKLTYSNSYGNHHAQIADGITGDVENCWRLYPTHTIGQWIQFTWDEEQVVKSVIIYDRHATEENIDEVLIEYGDGKSISSGNISKTGKGTEVKFKFPVKTKYIKLTVKSFSRASDGHVIGLEEVEIMAKTN